MTSFGLYSITNAHQKSNTPDTSSNFRHGYMIVYGWAQNRPIQILVIGWELRHEIYMRTITNTTPIQFGEWQKYSYDIPSFYKSYASLVGLNEGLIGLETTQAISNGSSFNIPKSTSAIFCAILRDSLGDTCAIVIKSWSSIFVISDGESVFSKTTSTGKMYLSLGTDRVLVCTNNTGTDRSINFKTLWART